MHKAIIVGCGRIAGAFDDDMEAPVRSHAHAYAVHPSLEVAEYVDVDPVKAQSLAFKYGSSSYSNDIEAALRRQQPAVVSVCTPDGTHFSITRSILLNDNRPEVIFLEKPACSNRAELDELISLSRETGVEVVVNHSRRFDPKHVALRKMIQEGSFGKLVEARLTYYSGWMHNGVHLVDTLGFLFNSPLQIEKCTGSIPGPYHGDPTLEFLMRMGDARILVNGFEERHYQLFEMDFRFDSCRLRLEDFGERVIFERKQVNSLKENVLLPEILAFEPNQNTAMYRAIDTIAKYLGGDSGLEGCGIEDIRQTMNTLWEGLEWQG